MGVYLTLFNIYFSFVVVMSTSAHFHLLLFTSLIPFFYFFLLKFLTLLTQLEYIGVVNLCTYSSLTSLYCGPPLLSLCFLKKFLRLNKGFTCLLILLTPFIYSSSL